jgi:hypothetical protein
MNKKIKEWYDNVPRDQDVIIKGEPCKIIYKTPNAFVVILYAFEKTSWSTEEQGFSS